MAAVKVTLTVPEDLLAAVDRYVEARDGATRSGVCADALQNWLRQKQEEEIAEYYLTLSEAERAEDASWTAAAAESAASTWR